MKEYENYEAELVSLVFLQEDQEGEGHYVVISDTLRDIVESQPGVRTLHEADWSKLIPHFKLSIGATANVEYGKPVDCSDGVFEITVTAQDGDYSRTYRVKLTRKGAVILPPAAVRESGVELLDFRIKELEGRTDVSFEQEGVYLTYVVPKGVQLAALTPEFTLSTGARYESGAWQLGQVHDFSKPLMVTVISEDESARCTYCLMVNHPVEVVNSEAAVESFKIEELQMKPARISGSKIFIEVPYPTPANELTPNYKLSAGATCSDLENEVRCSFPKEGRKMTVTSEDGSSKNEYVIYAYQVYSAEAWLSEMKFYQTNGTAITPIESEEGYTFYTSGNNIDLKKVKVTFKTADNATVCREDGTELQSGEELNFSGGTIKLIVTAQDGKHKVTKILKVEKSEGTLGATGGHEQITSFKVSGKGWEVNARIDTHYIEAVVPLEADLTHLKVEYEIGGKSNSTARLCRKGFKDQGLTIRSGDIVDFSKPLGILESWLGKQLLARGEYCIRVVKAKKIEETMPILNKIKVNGESCDFMEREGIVYVTVPIGTDLTNLKVEGFCDQNGSLVKFPSRADYSQLVSFEILSANRTHKATYQLKIEPQMNDRADITNVKVSEIEGKEGTTRIVRGGSIYYKTTEQVDISNLRVTFDLPRGAKSTVSSGTVHDFTKPLTIQVTSEDGKMMRSYTVQVKQVLRSGASVEHFKILGLSKQECSVEGNFIFFGPLKAGENVRSCRVEFVLSDGATSSFESGSVQDLSTPLKLTVTSEDKNFVRTYTIQEAAPGLTFDFEDWREEGGYWIPSGEWSSGNVGVSIAKGMSGKPKQYPGRRSSAAHSGSYAAVLSTEELGVAGNRIAAGAYYLGSFDKSNVMGDPLSCTKFGVDWPVQGAYPSHFKGWYKYKAGADNLDGKGRAVGKKDEMSLFVVFYYGATLTGHDVETSDRIIAMAKVPSKESAEYVSFKVPFVYKRSVPKGQPLKYSIVLSSSTKGAFFEGAIGSELYVDELEIQYQLQPEGAVIE